MISPILRPQDGGIVGLCLVGWVTWSLLIGFIGHRLSPKFLETDTCLTQPLPWEEDFHWYDQVLGIKHWKDRLPEAENFFPGGVRKGVIGGGDLSVLSQFLAETRRAEYVHIAIWPFWLVTMLWTPGWGVLVNLVVGTALNLPCLLVQRYNRLRLHHLLTLKGKNKSSG